MTTPTPTSRRTFLQSAAALGGWTALQSLWPSYARAAQGLASIERRGAGTPIDLTVREEPMVLADREAKVMAFNGSVPGPLLRLHEGEDLTIHVHNGLDESTSVHWHGLILPYEMDGVPGVSYPGIDPKSTFTYRFPVHQNGTYWYHSHTGLQEQLGHYGPIVIDPEGPDPVSYDREHVIVLSDWTFENPYKVLARLKKLGGYYNYQERTISDFFDDISRDGWRATVRDRRSWGGMRMTPTDIADITGFTYTYLCNGLAPLDNWTGLFEPGERVRLRIINAATMTYFNVRIPDVPMTVVQADGQNVRPVKVDEFQIAPAETFDVVVTPPKNRAYTFFAEAMDRSGYARGTLATREGDVADIPPLRERPLRTMVDMGMAMDDGAMGGMAMPNAPSGSDAHDGHGDSMAMGGMSKVGPEVARHGDDTHGVGNTSVATVQRNRLGEPGTGLDDVGHRVLVYTDLMRLDDEFDERTPTQEVELHLTGNMERYIWSFDGKKFSETNAPIHFPLGERLRFVMVNDTMMEHPIHLHGMWMELENGHGHRIPRKHTVSIKPSERLSVLVDVDAPGRWALHCHLLYHMDMGMFRVVEVS